MANVVHVIWCSGCSSEQAVDLLEVEWEGEWVAFPVGLECLTRAQSRGIIEEQE